MPKNKLCCRIFPLVLIFISAIINAGIWYLDEGAHEFRFLINRDEFFNYLGTTLAIALLPIGLFYYLSDKETYGEKARQFSLIGFLPAIGFLIFLLL